MNKIKKAFYSIGIFSMFCMEIIFFYDCISHKMNIDNIINLFFIVCSFYSLCIMISKIIKSTDYLINVQRIMYNKNTSKEEKINSLNFCMFDIDAFLNDK